VRAQSPASGAAASPAGGIQLVRSGARDITPGAPAAHGRDITPASGGRDGGRDIAGREPSSR